MMPGKEINEADKTNCFYYYTCPKIITCVGCRSYEIVKNGIYNDKVNKQRA